MLTRRNSPVPQGFMVKPNKYGATGVAIRVNSRRNERCRGFALPSIMC